MESDMTVGIVGAGAMGAGIAQVAARAGTRVLLFDERPEAAQQATLAVAASLSKLAARGQVSPDELPAILARMQAVATLSDFAACELVIEAIVEDLSAKRQVFRSLEDIVSAAALLATNTSSLSVSAIAAGMRHPGRVAGMHFFNPAPVMPLVEIVSGLDTHPETLTRLEATARSWGKQTVRARSTPGFIVNRVARPFYAEALRLLTERASDHVTLDAILREAGGFRMGPFELMDLIGNDVNFAPHPPLPPSPCTWRRRSPRSENGTGILCLRRERRGTKTPHHGALQLPRLHRSFR